jgi:branched-chain amino acid transport system substrate-binding protein
MKISANTLPLALAAVLGVAACSKEAPSSDANAPITIRFGHAAPLTGPQAHLGKDNENGARLAVEDANAANLTFGGRAVKFELLSEDDQSDPRQGNLVAQKFVDAKVNAVIGHHTRLPAVFECRHPAGVAFGNQSDLHRPGL